MKIQKYQNGGKTEGEMHINIEPVTVTPEPGQYALRDGDDRENKRRIYDKLRTELYGVVRNPLRSEYDQAAEEISRRFGDEIYSASLLEEYMNEYKNNIANRYYQGNPLNSEEGYYRLKEFHDNPGKFLKSYGNRLTIPLTITDHNKLRNLK